MKTTSLKAHLFFIVTGALVALLLVGGMGINNARKQSADGVEADRVTAAVRAVELLDQIVPSIQKTSEALSGKAQHLRQSIGFFNIGSVPATVHGPQGRLAHERRQAPLRLSAAPQEAPVRGGQNNFKPY